MRAWGGVPVRAVCLTPRRSLDLCDLTLPEPSAGQVRVRVEYVGICGSDLHYYYHGENAGFVLKEPLIPGHELSGTVDLDPTGRRSPGTAVTAPGPLWAASEALV